MSPCGQHDTDIIRVYRTPDDDQYMTVQSPADGMFLAMYIMDNVGPIGLNYYGFYTRKQQEENIQALHPGGEWREVTL